MADLKIETITRGPPLPTGPLKILESTQALSILKYPSNLGDTGDSNNKKHWVTFRIYDIAPAGLKSAATGLKDNNTVLAISNTTAVGTAVADGAAGAGIAALSAFTKKNTTAEKGLGIAAGAGTAVIGILAAAGLGTGFTPMA
jgi:hypothetical protein